jgi:predicted  nucleic acid-binding Zn-ribbon protein
MFKDVIAPIQAWLLSQNRCVGCGKDLTKSKVKNLADGTRKVVCECGRIFVYDPKTKKYRRALLEEV